MTNATRLALKILFTSLTNVLSKAFRNRLSQTSFSFSETDTDQSYATVTHRRVDIGKVNILFQIGRHDFGYALGRDCQCFIRFTIRLWEPACRQNFSIAHC